MTHFVGYAAERPNIGLKVVGLVLPDFGAGVVGRARLRVQEAPLGDFGDVQIAELGRSVLV